MSKDFFAPLFSTASKHLGKLQNLLVFPNYITQEKDEIERA